MKTTTGKETKVFPLRLPPPLHARLRKTAYVRGISMHQCVLSALDNWLEPAENIGGPATRGLPGR